MKTLFFLIALLFAAPASAQQIYKWQDTKGQWHFSQSPPPPGVQADVMREIETSPDVLLGSGRVAQVLAVMERQEGQLLEVRFEQSRMQQIVHVASKLTSFKKGDMLEFYNRPKDEFSYIIRHWPTAKEDFIGTIPRPEATK